jgi:hypothetical protein
MTLKYGPDSKEESRSEKWPPAQLTKPRRPIYLVVTGALIVLFGMAGFVWWLLDSTVPLAEHEAVTLSLSEAEAELADVAAENARLTDEAQVLSRETGRLGDELAELSAERQQVSQDLTSLVKVARATAVLFAWYDPEYIAELRSAGLDETGAEALMQDLGFSQTYPEWVEAYNWQDVNRIMIEVPDERVQEIWDEYANAEFGSVEEEIAFVEFVWRLSQVLLESLMGLDTGTLST